MDKMESKMFSFKEELKYIFLVFFSFLVIYILTINQCMTVMLDAAGYVGEIANREVNFFPHHLLYHVSFLYWSDFLQVFGMTNIVYNIGLFNALFASMSMAMIYLILRQRYGIKRLLALSYLLLPGFSYGFWIVATSSNVYMVPLFCLLTCYYIFLQDENSIRKWVFIALFHSIAILYNQWNVFFFPAVLFSVLFSKDKGYLLRKFFPYYLAVLSLIVVGVYVLVAVLHENVRSVPELFSWLTFYSQHFSWTTSVKGVLRDSIIGIALTMIAPYWMFSSGLFAPFLAKVLPGQVTLAEEAFLVRSISDTGAIMYFFLTIGSLVGLGLIVFKTLRKIKTFFREKDIKAIFIVFWIISSSIMPLFWSGFVLRFWFTQTTIFYLMSFLVFPQTYTNWKKWIPALTGLLMFILTLQSTIIPATDKQNDLIFHKVKSLGSNIKQGDLVIHHGIWNFGHYIKIYRTGTDEFRADNLVDEQKLRTALDLLKNIDKRLEKNNLYLFEEVVNKVDTYPPEAASLIKNILEKYKLNIRHYDTKYVDYYVISTR